MVNLPNALSLGRIAAAPFIAWLPLLDSWELRLAAFLLFVIAAVTDYVDGMLARTRGLITDLGRLLDPLADKLLLVATFIPMYVLMTSPRDWPASLWPHLPRALPSAFEFPFRTPVGDVPLPFWVVAVVIGREIVMTIFRQAAARRGVVISAIGPAKWKTAFQSVWVGSAYAWFFAATLARTEVWDANRWWRAFASFNGIVGSLTMIIAVALTLYSLALYVARYGSVFARATPGR